MTITQWIILIRAHIISSAHGWDRLLIRKLNLHNRIIIVIERRPSVGQFICLAVCTYLLYVLKFRMSEGFLGLDCRFHNPGTNVPDLIDLSLSDSMMNSVCLL